MEVNLHIISFQAYMCAHKSPENWNIAIYKDESIFVYYTLWLIC